MSSGDVIEQYGEHSCCVSSNGRAGHKTLQCVFIHLFTESGTMWTLSLPQSKNGYKGKHAEWTQAIVVAGTGK